MTEYTREVWVRVCMLAIWLALAVGGVAVVSPDRDLAFGAALGVAIVAGAGVLRPIKASHLILAGAFALVFGVIQALRKVAPGADPNAPYVAAAAVGAFAFAITAMVADTLRDAFIRYDAELESRQKIIEEVESVDTATGATKRQHADRLLNIEVERARRYSRQFTMVIIGPDKWEEFVTVNGQGQADRTVTALSHEYLTRLRNVDTLIHMEGATFAVLLPETPVTGAQVVAEKLVDVGEVILGGGGELRAGIAGFPDDEVTGGGLIREATEALHFAEAASIRVASRSLLS
ncbi:MAG: diguanylate cyclase [Dehalococcoidia bacterium]|nr:MAG: diguanylate cyclase [Dehalococcoidia bacterium]